MKKLFTFITLLLCTPNTHTAVALEDLPTSLQKHEIPTYVNIKKAAQLREESPLPSSGHPYFFNKEANKHCFANQAATVLESRSIPNLEKIGHLALLDNAYWEDRKKIIAHMIKHEMNINDIVYENFKSNQGPTPLCSSIEFGDIDFARYLVHRGADVNRYTEVTPLMIVVKKMAHGYPLIKPVHFKFLELLIFAGAHADFIPPNQNNVSIRRSIAPYFEIKETIKKVEKGKKEIESLLFIIKNTPPILNDIVFDYLSEDYARLIQKANF